MRLLGALSSLLGHRAGAWRRIFVPVSADQVGGGEGASPRAGRDDDRRIGGKAADDEHDRNGAAGEVDWDAVRRLYEAGEVPVRAIRAAHGLTGYRLRKAYREGGWRRRPQVARPGPNQGRQSVDPDLVARRLVRLLSAKIKPLQPANEADLQAFAAEGMMRQDRRRRRAGPDGDGGSKRSIQPAAGGGHSQTDEDAAHVEWMRSELKRRLRVLAGDEPAGTGEPHRPDGGAGA